MIDAALKIPWVQFNERDTTTKHQVRSLYAADTATMDPWEKSHTVDPEVRAYVYSLVNAIGGRSTYDDSYAVGDDAAAVLKDLTRWLKLYDEKTGRYDVKRCLAEANVVKGDLLEILAQWPEGAQDNKFKRKQALGCLELLTPLTWPLELDKTDDDKTVNFHRHVPYLQLAQVGYKRALMHFEGAQILRTIVRIGLPAIAQPRRERSPRDEGLIRVMLYLFRNIAMIAQPQHLPSQGDENEITRSATIDAFKSQDIFSLLLTLGSSVQDEFQEHDLVLLEILYALLKGIDARKLFMKKEQYTKNETKEFKDLLSKEKAMLNSYNKHAPTRHHRFGTMVWVKRDEAKMSTVSGQHSITNDNQTLYQMDKSKKWDKPKYRGKLAKEFNEQSDFGMQVELTESARDNLRSFVEDFLDSSFNPLFACLRRTIERDQVEEKHGSLNIKQYFYLISWFLTAEAARRDAVRRDNGWRTDRPSQTGADENTYAYIAAVLDQETFVLLNRKMQRAYDDKDWQVLQATLLAFTQILLTVQTMAESKDEEDQEIAENIQNRIFYEETTHDLIVQMLRGYTHQGFAYLDAVTECVHVFVRMLERYSKTNVDMHIRSKRKARRRQKKDQPAGGDANEDAEQAEEDQQDAQRTVSERKFDFARFSAKFLSQKCVDTFVALLQFYRELSPAQLKRCHRYFYRLAFKHELAVLLFRVDILLLFHRLIKGPEGLNPEIDGFKDWEQLVQQVFRRCIKWVSKESEGEGWKEMCVVEMLFSKIPNSLFYLQNGFDHVVEKKASRPPAELDFKAAVEEGQKVGVAVGVMLEQNKADGVAWVREELKRAIAERESWENEQSARAVMQDGTEDNGAEAPSTEAPGIFLSHSNSEERKLALFKDKHLRLLLTTLGYKRLGVAEDVDASWVLTSELSSEMLKASLAQIQQAEFDPPTFEDGKKSATDMVRPKGSYTRPTRSAGPFDDASDADEGVSDIDEAMFPPNMREKRKRDDGVEKPKKRRRLKERKEVTESDAEERAKSRREKERERNAKIKSNLFITASDDESDDERDAEFYRLEEERRKKMRGIIRNQLLKEAEQAGAEADEADGGQNTKAKKNRKAKKAKEKLQALDETLDEDLDDLDHAMPDADESEGGEATVDSPRTRRRKRLFEAPVNDASSDSESDSEPLRRHRASDVDEEETPSTSPAAVDEGRPLTEVSGNAGKEARTEEEDEDEDAPVVKRAVPPARRVRAGFVVDDDSDEE